MHLIVQSSQALGITRFTYAGFQVFLLRNEKKINYLATDIGNEQQVHILQKGKLKKKGLIS